MKDNQIHARYSTGLSRHNIEQALIAVGKDLDPDLVTDMLGHPALTPSLHSHNIRLRQTPHTTSVQLVPLRRSLKSAVSR